MKHPRYEVLQDYFENVLNLPNEKLVKDHLLSCDQCTKVLAQFIHVENKVKNQSPLEISSNTKEKIFKNAQSLLLEKSAEIKRRKEQKELFINFVQDWKDVLFPEIKMPALQVYSVSLMVTVIAIAAQMEPMEEKYYKPLPTDVNIFTYKDLGQYKTEN